MQTMMQAVEKRDLVESKRVQIDYKLSVPGRQVFCNSVSTLAERIQIWQVTEVHLGLKGPMILLDLHVS